MRIVEVGPRDGLQNETAQVPTGVKVAFVEALAGSGVHEIEVSAFVSPRRVPQLADAEAVFARLSRRPGVVYSALVPNASGLERALAAGVDKIAVFTAASETFARRNINTSIAGSLERFRPVVDGARRAGLPVRGYVSTAFWCAFEGPIAPPAVAAVVDRLADLGVDEVAVSDTVGRACPEDVQRLLEVLLPRLDPGRIAMHFHDTCGRGVANVEAAWGCGIRVFDGSAGGLGGCPFSPGATGNVATEAVVGALASLGADPGVDVRSLTRARRLLDPYLADARRPTPAARGPVCPDCTYAAGPVCAPIQGTGS
jgi:hydroxymethylglutaryl-CoA lyase